MFETLFSNPHTLSNPEFTSPEFCKTITWLMASLSDSMSNFAYYLMCGNVPDLILQGLRKHRHVEFAFALGSSLGRSFQGPAYLKASPVRLPLFRALDQFIHEQRAEDLRNSDRNPILDLTQRQRWTKWRGRVAEALGISVTDFGPDLRSPEELKAIDEEAKKKNTKARPASPEGGPGMPNPATSEEVSGIILFGQDVRPPSWLRPWRRRTDSGIYMPVQPLEQITVSQER